ncbi:MAG TPA: HAMP domain-containing sensor histidine kinase [Clostridia bacterium]|nr:HAMP domain-containing sensor histidine kinase [Clostridia bacterium]
MFKSIFSRMLITYLLLISVIIILLSFAITNIYKWYVFDTKKNELKTAAYQVNKLANGYLKGQTSLDELNASLDSIGYITDSKIYVVKMDKKTLKSTKKLKLGEVLDESYVIKGMQTVLDGKTVFSKEQYSAKMDMYIVFMGVPWQNEKGITGSILIFSPTSILNENIRNIRTIIWTIAVIFILLSIAATYINALRISRPIFKIEQAANKIASGKNAEDIVIKTNDEIERLANSFNHMKKELAKTEEIRREFIASISHDLKTPLTSIKGFVEAMLDNVVEQHEHDKYLHFIEDEASRLTRLTDEILQFAKIQSGNIKLRRENLDVKDIMESVLSSVKIPAEEKSINIKVQCSDNIKVFADEDRLKQVLINILGNAIKYTGKGGNIDVQVEDLFSKVIFRIKDDGMGITPEDLPYIFEKFYRADKSRQSSNGGTGLGLSIAKSLIELHEGRIWALSDYSKGTEICFELPS